MPIDEVKFGELIGTVGALVTAVSDMKAAIIPALHRQQEEMALHKEEDAAIRNKIENIAEWKEGKGTKKGAEQTIDDLDKGKSRLIAFIGGITVTGGLAGNKLGELITKIWGMF